MKANSFVKQNNSDTTFEIFRKKRIEHKSCKRKGKSVILNMSKSANKQMCLFHER